MCVLKNSLVLSHEMAEKVIKQGDSVIDATAGNGNDTLFLSKLAGSTGKVYSFDIQQQALDKTAQRLQQAGVYGDASNVKLIHDGHQNLDRYVSEEVSLIMFNLGYLPGGDHSIGTKAASTIEAVQKGLNLLKKNGIMIIVIYYGGDSGFAEKEEVQDFLRTLDCRKYTVLQSEFVNQVNCPPIFVCIEKWA